MTLDGTGNSRNQPLNLPDGTVHGPLSLSGENVNLRCRNSLMILGTLHHQGSMKGFKKYLEMLINAMKALSVSQQTLDRFSGRERNIPRRGRPTA